jgi:alpha-pyrone synthase
MTRLLFAPDNQKSKIKNQESHTVVQSIATANPPLGRSQEFAAAFMQRIESLPAPIRKRIPELYARSGIDFRYSCVEDYGRTSGEEFDFFPSDGTFSPAPGTARRNAKYREAVIPLAEGVTREALDLAGLAPGEITHVVAVSCTGFFSPGLDVELVRRLGMPPDVQRTFVGFMGCYAAFNGLRLAHAFCQSHPGARVLLVCAELCTLHFQIAPTLESAVVNALFSDGAAAAVLASRPAAEAAGRLTYAGGHALLDGDSMRDMTWDIGDTGFLMGLSSRVPQVIADNLPAYVETLLHRNGLTPEDVGFWAIHPGGRAIVEKTQQVLGLADEDVFDSLEVLRLHGNMSSPTILFILKRFLDRYRGGSPTSGVAMAFGPGLTLEGAVFRIFE